MRWVALAAVAAALLAGAYASARAVDRRLRRAHGHYTDARGATVLRYRLHSRPLDRDLDEVGIVPAGGGTRPLLVFLHGRGMATDALLSDGLFRALAGLGPRAPAIVFVDGGDHSYYHDRRDGPWGSYVLREAIPDALRRLHADPARVAIGGISMGGFGALDLARLDPSRFCAVGGHSAALWRSGGETAAGAFDDAQDFARHDVVNSPFPFRGPVWLDVGSSDPFLAADTAFARAHGLRLHVWPGSHDGSYWASHLRAYLRFYAQALRSCRR
jgi:S-formylglutathione hydrolase FrmB